MATSICSFISQKIKKLQTELVKISNTEKDKNHNCHSSKSYNYYLKNQ